MKKLFTFSLALLLSAICWAQSIISGQVTDADTKLPLEGASVFAQNTTKGVITDKEGHYTIALNKGGYELIISYTGYASQTINITASENQQLNIELKKEDNSLGEVVVTASNLVADGWEKYGSFFINHFIGATPYAANCSLQNPEALKFYYHKRSDKLKVLATEPLQIENRSLGYHMRYELDSFVYYYPTSINSYRGNCLYTAMEGDTAQQHIWSANRKKVYYGSRLHFLRSYYDSTLQQDGFTVDMLSATDAAKFNRLANPYDSIYYGYIDSTADVELWFPKKVSITYIKKAPEAEYLQQYRLPLDVKTQISYVDLLDAILIKPNGYFTSQKSWIAQGYWSWKNIADQLPYDYEPEE